MRKRAERVWWWFEASWLYEKILQLKCLRGHDPVRDHCGLPEHDFCARCGKLTPFAADHPSKSQP